MSGDLNPLESRRTLTSLFYKPIQCHGQLQTPHYNEFDILRSASVETWTLVSWVKCSNEKFTVTKSVFWLVDVGCMGCEERASQFVDIHQSLHQKSCRHSKGQTLEEWMQRSNIYVIWYNSLKNFEFHISCRMPYYYWERTNLECIWQFKRLLL